ncbi:MAG: glycosyltransferase family 39 protein [Bacteroidota bacterium]
MGALSKSDVPGVEKALRLLLFLALAMRLYGLSAFSLSNDELSALSRLQFDSLIDVLKFGVYPDYHPAGVQLFLFYWTGLFGFDEWVVRLPFAWMGVVSVYLVFRIGKSWFGEATGLLAAGSMAVLEFTLLYSQIARPYSPGLMFALLTVFYWSRFLGFENETNAENKMALLRY